jgi:hypothetical protein
MARPQVGPGFDYLAAWKLGFGFAGFRAGCALFHCATCAGPGLGCVVGGDLVGRTAWPRCFARVRGRRTSRSEIKRSPPLVSQHQVRHQSSEPEPQIAAPLGGRAIRGVTSAEPLLDPPPCATEAWGIRQEMRAVNSRMGVTTRSGCCIGARWPASMSRTLASVMRAASCS